jgi:hypothetical protein
VRRRHPGQGKARDPQVAQRWTVERTNAWLHNQRRITSPDHLPPPQSGI